MIKTAGHQQVRVRENVRGGEGALVFHDFLVTEESFGAGKLFSRTVLPAGTSIGEHRHDGEFEVYYVLEGTVELSNAQGSVTVSQGEGAVATIGQAEVTAAISAVTASRAPRARGWA